MLCICWVYTIHILTIFLSGTWLSPRSQYYAPEAATFQRVWTGCFYRNWLSGLQILQTCIVSDSRWINIHKFQSVEFESDLYRGVMRARCYPFNMERHRFRGRNGKVGTYTWYSNVYDNMYMLVIFVVYTCTELIVLSATIPPHPFYIGERDNDYDVAELLFDQDSMWFVRLSAAVLMVWALPSLAWAASLWPKQRRSEGSPGLRLPSADGQLSRRKWPSHGICLKYAWYIPCISPVYPVRQ